jgi:hypothetical protein
MPTEAADTGTLGDYRRANKATYDSRDAAIVAQEAAFDASVASAARTIAPPAVSPAWRPRRWRKGGNVVPRQLQAPTVTSLSPVAGTGQSVGGAVQINGTNLEEVERVIFHTAKDAVFVRNSPTRVTATVPAGATTGTIRIVTADGVVDTASYTIL